MNDTGDGHYEKGEEKRRSIETWEVEGPLGCEVVLLGLEVASLFQGGVVV